MTKKPIFETIDLSNLRLFAAVAECQSFTGAGRKLAMPKQTLSRRIAALEQSLGVQLLERSTRTMRLTPAGEAFAERCQEIVLTAEDAVRAITDVHPQPRGRLRLTADPVFGEAFVSGLVIDYARRYPQVDLDVVYTQRKVDLIQEGFDLAFRVGETDRPGLINTDLMPARVRYCASPDYIRANGTPKKPDELAQHSCILVHPEGASVRWPFASAGRVRMLSVTGRLRFSSFELAHQAVLAGLGVGIFPQFKCDPDIRADRLVPVLDDWAANLGTVSLVHTTRQFLSPRIKAFLDLVAEQFDREDPAAQTPA